MDTLDTGYLGYYSITHTAVCAILAKIQYCNAIHGYQRIHVPPGSESPQFDSTRNRGFDSAPARKCSIVVACKRTLATLAGEGAMDRRKSLTKH